MLKFRIDFVKQQQNILNLIQQEYQLMLRTKKSSFEGSRFIEIEQRIKQYIKNKTAAQQQYCQTFNELLSVYGIHTYFNNLELYLHLDMFLEFKKNSVIQDGVYLLLKGSLVYTWVKNRNDKDRRDHLFSLAKLNSFSNLNEFAPDRDLLLTNGYSILINNPMSVAECQNGNIATCEDCILIKIPSKILEITEFYKMKAWKEQAFSMAKLQQIRINAIQKVVSLNCNLHHTFRNKKFAFRSKFEVESLAVIVNGCVLITKNGQNKVEISKYSLILPSIQYEVSSAQLQIIEVINNPTIVFTKPSIIQQIIESYKIKIRRNSQIEQKQEVKRYRHKINNSISLHKSQNQCKFSKEYLRKKKQFRLLSKQNEDYWIVSSELNKQNMMNMHKNKKNSIEGEEKRPRALFNYSKKIRYSENQKQASERNDQQKKLRQSFVNKKTLIDRYENYAKNIFKQYKNYKKSQDKKIKFRNNNQFQKWKA